MNFQLKLSSPDNGLPAPPLPSRTSTCTSSSIRFLKNITVACSIHLNATMQYLALTCGRIHVLLAAQADGAKLFEQLPQLESLHGKVFLSSGESMIVNLRTFPGSRLCHRLPSTERAPSSWAGKLLHQKFFEGLERKLFLLQPNQQQDGKLWRREVKMETHRHTRIDIDTEKRTDIQKNRNT